MSKIFGPAFVLSSLAVGVGIAAAVVVGWDEVAIVTPPMSVVVAPIEAEVPTPRHANLDLARLPPVQPSEGRTAPEPPPLRQPQITSSTRGPVLSAPAPRIAQSPAVVAPAATANTVAVAALPRTEPQPATPDSLELLQRMLNAPGASGTPPQVNISELTEKLRQNPEQMQQVQQLLQGGALRGLLGNNGPGTATGGNASGLDLKTLTNMMSLLGGAMNSAPPVPAAAPELTPAPPPQATAQPLPSPPTRLESKNTITHDFDGEGDNHLTINIREAELREVLEQISEQGGLNILASGNVQGKVSASLKGVDVNAALDAILKSSGYVSRREGKFIYVGTPKDFDELKTNLDVVGTRVYRPNYVTAKELQALITPLLTTGTGKSSVTSPANQGIAVNGNEAGGDNYSHGEAVVVQDFEAVLSQVDEVVEEIDQRPMQVAIEAMVLSVTLNDQTKFGVDFQFLRDQQHVRFGTGAPRTAALNGAGTPDGAGGINGEFKFAQGGLQFAFLDDSLGVFINALETIGDTNVIATPRLLCLNKQRAEILIGSQVPYTTSTVTQTFTTQTVQFLDIGTQLRLRPFISSDGSIRMEVHPEISSAVANPNQGVNNPPTKNITQVTTNIMCYDGCTVVIGGLMEEDLQSTTSQVPFLGSLPIIGPLWRTKTDSIVRREILVLVTPRIVYSPEYNVDSDQQQYQYQRRHEVAEESQTLLSRTSTARRYVKQGRTALRDGDATRARRLADLALRFNPNDLEASSLAAEVDAILPPTPIGPWKRVQPGVPPASVVPPASPRTNPDAPPATDWMLDELQGTSTTLAPLHPRDPGTMGNVRRIEARGEFGRDR